MTTGCSGNEMANIMVEVEENKTLMVVCLAPSVCIENPDNKEDCRTCSCCKRYWYVNRIVRKKVNTNG
jgi:hypothetical protein